MNSLMLAAAHTTNLQTTELTLWLSVLRGQAVAYATLLSLSLIAGCGPQNPTTYPVQGRVEFEDGSVAEIGNVEFRSMTGNERMTARGKIENDGSFILSTFETGDGALPGEHQVIVPHSSQVLGLRSFWIECPCQGTTSESDRDQARFESKVGPESYSFIQQDLFDHRVRSICQLS
jgi:hypothetical protein